MASKQKPANGYWGVLEPFWEKINIYRGSAVFRRTYGAAPPIERDLFAAHFCESEVSNGGLHQFFMNPTGVLAPEAAAAFRRVGFKGTASSLEKAMEFFGARYPREQRIRAARLDAFARKNPDNWDPFLRLTARFYRSLGRQHAPFFNALDRYAQAGQARRRRTSGCS
jgi:hypothetical protein